MNVAKPKADSKLSREFFSHSRGLEYLSENELTKQIGYPRPLWLLALLKELLDNSLDNCEEIGRLPRIVVTFTGAALAVRDNGDGIPPEIVEATLDFNTRTSTRNGYRGPTRGAQGNASMTVISLPYVLNGTHGKTIIKAKGVRHEITVGVDPLLQQAKFEHRREEQKVQIGTFVEVRFAEYPMHT